MKTYIMKHKYLVLTALFFDAIFAIGSTLLALLLKDVIDVALAQDMDRFIHLVYQTIFYMSTICFSYWLYIRLSSKFICKITSMIRSDLMNGILQRNISDFRSVNSADYLSALNNDITNIEENYLKSLLQCLQSLIVFVTSFAILLYLSPLVMICLLCAISLLIIIPSLFQGSIQKHQENVSKKQADLTITSKDFLSGFEVIQSYHMKDYVINAFEASNEQMYQTKFGLEKIIAIVEALSAVLGVGVQCSVLFIAAYLILTGNITAGSLVAIVQVSGTIVSPIQVLSQNLPKIQGCKPILDRLQHFSKAQNNSFLGTQSPSFEQGIMIQDVHFGYTSEQEVLNGLNFHFHKGKKYAIVGKSGCGKTTLINLLSGYYDKYLGEILYDQDNIKDLDIKKLNEKIAIIHQNIYMFDESIQDNITLHKDITHDALQQAIQISGVSMFLNDQTTLTSRVGENGNQLSGGQRQRIAVARALAQQKPILILDEGTSAIDSQTAFDIESNLLKMNDITILTITHALLPELLQSYDEILYMEDGRIMEADTFDNLINKQGSFHAFYRLHTSS